MFGRARHRTRNLHAAKKEEKSKPQRREERTIELDDRMKNRKVFGKVSSNGRVVAKRNTTRQELCVEDVIYEPIVRNACDKIVRGFEAEFREEMKYTYILILKYLEIQKEKEKRRKISNNSGERKGSNAHLETVEKESCSKQETREEEFEREIQKALGKDDHDN